MNKQTVWIQDGEGEFSHNDFSSTHNFNLKEYNGYFLTEEEMRELLSNAFNAGADRNYHLNHKDDQNGTWVPNSTQYIDTLLK
jgi:hypothetical protein